MTDVPQNVSLTPEANKEGQDATKASGPSLEEVKDGVVEAEDD